MTREPSHWPDMAEQIDTLHDTLQEDFSELHTQPKLSRKFAEWHLKRVDVEANTIAAGIAAEALTRLAETDGPLQTQALGALFASGLHGRIGFNSITKAANATGRTVAAISKHNTATRRKLSLPDNVHSKSAEACATYSEINKRNHWRKALRTEPEVKLITGNSIKYMFMRIINMPIGVAVVRRRLRNKEPMRVFVGDQQFNCIERAEGIELVTMEEGLMGAPAKESIL